MPREDRLGVRYKGRLPNRRRDDRRLYWFIDEKRSLPDVPQVAQTAILPLFLCLMHFVHNAQRRELAHSSRRVMWTPRPGLDREPAASSLMTHAAWQDVAWFSWRLGALARVADPLPTTVVTA